MKEVIYVQNKTYSASQSLIFISLVLFFLLKIFVLLK